MTCYATLAQAKSAMNAEDTTDDTTLLALIRQVSNRIDRMFYKRAAPFFAPFLETRNQFHLDGSRVNTAQGTFYVGTPLLALTSVTVGTQALTVGSQVTLWQSEYGVYDTLALVSPWTNTWYSFACCPNAPVYVTIAGTWGYNADYANAWIDSGQDIPAGGITGSATSFTVTDVDGANALGLTPALSAGNLIQVDSEWMEVTATDTTTNTVTVRRGVNGSTAAAHTAGTAIYTYQVEEQVMRATARQAGLLYAKRGAYDNTTVQDLTAVTFPADVLAEFSALLSLFTN